MEQSKKKKVWKISEVIEKELKEGMERWGCVDTSERRPDIQPVDN